MQATPSTVRPPAVAGAFYPSGAAPLRREVDALLAEATARAPRPKALVVPHAGYVYSGPVAASAYAVLARAEPKPTRVVLLGPAHHVGFRGLALPPVEALATPLGLVPLDADLADRVLRLGSVRPSWRVHQHEHSLEVQLPFLQRALDAFTVLPLAVGDAGPEEVAEVLEAAWGGDETVIVVSSDLSHYLPYDQAREADAATAQRILACDARGIGDADACGARPLSGLLLVARRRGLAPRLLDLRSSGDTAGDRGRVVGYGAFAFVPEGAPS